ncbi:serine/threonine-protein kinase [Ktedonospora formicarum]|uniref:non-specific serine/threonine protein kinase n=1 Tax=Ktedonospora formicarum TaxID=2778364 RepID=A0A8J3HZN6_9CHLR|nr:serine/threonine-protein kinase [Ktedonospora formicarum]GHO42874.1 hypothetical protein KSX_10370 [Ktedonospora formicarum]
MILDTNELIGQTLGTCTLRRLIGRGGMGAVYLAQQTRPRRTVAVKVLLPHTMMDKRPRDEFLARFRREADAIAALDHINILPLYEYGEQEDMAYLVMPYVTGGTLREMLEKQGVLSLEDTVRIVEQAADALDTAHAQGIVHRDLKPANILFHADGRALLADFGLAKVVRDLRESGIKGRSSQEGLTSAGTIVGTPEYLSPEQGTGKPVDHHTDIYSLGVMIYQMLGGQVPFSGTSPVAIAIKHTLEAPPSLAKLNPRISPETEAIVMKALAKDPEQRHNSAGELARALKASLISASPNRVEAPVVSNLADAHTIMEVYPPRQQPETNKPFEVQHPQLILGSEDVTHLEDKPTSIYSGSTDASSRIVAHVEAKRDEAAPPIPPRLETAPPPQPIYQPTPAFPQQHGQATGAGTPVNHPPFAPQTTPWQPTPPPAPRVKRQIPALALLSALVVLLLIVGSFATYRYVTQNQNEARGATPTTTPSTNHDTKSTPQVTPTPKSLSLPGAKVPAGSLIYGTDLPGTQCDKQGGTWKVTNASIKCNDNNVDVSSSGGTGVLLLTGLPKNQSLPNDYVIQIETVQTSGEYGIVYRTLPDTNQNNVLMLADASWHSDTYDTSWNIQGSPLANGPGIGNANGKHTINVRVQGESYTYFVDGTNWGSAGNGVPTQPMIGILIPAGSHITIKNFQIFAL